MQVPHARGPISATVGSWLRSETTIRPAGLLDTVDGLDLDPLVDDDLQITLWMLYELHYGGFDDVDDRWEWSPELLIVRQRLESRFERSLREDTARSVAGMHDAADDVAARLFAFVDAAESAPLANHLQRTADREQAREFLVHRSIYQLKEADPHTWAVPRLVGQPKVSLVELQFDEYGAGRLDRQHARLFADALAACDLDPTYGAYVDVVPAVTLALSNLVSMFGLHRRLRGAAMGHLAAFESTSSLPARRIAMGLRRLGLPGAAALYFDEHIEADAVHEQVAMRDICAAMVAQDATMLPDIVFGAAACLHLDERSGRHLLDRWAAGTSSLEDASLAVPA